MLFPKKQKYRTLQRGRKHPEKRTRAKRGCFVTFGDYGMQAATGARVKANQIEAARRVITRSVGKGNKVWIRIFPDRPFTNKGDGTPMGKGKGSPTGFEVEVLPGRILFEVSGASEEKCKEALKKASRKLPLKARVVSRYSI